MQGPAQRVTRGAILMLISSIVGMVGYLLAGWSLLDSLYMVAITIFSVGYAEVHPITDPGLKLFTIGFIISGCSALLYTLGGLFQFITEGEINRALGQRRMHKTISKLNDHTIVCGWGRIGRVVADELFRTGVPPVIVDLNSGLARVGDEMGAMLVNGDATHDSTLMEAGIERARALATVLPNDALNVFITLTARNLNPDLFIVARAEDPASEAKLLQAGANIVVLPTTIGAFRIAHTIKRPTATQLFDEDELRALGEELTLIGVEIDEYTVRADSPLRGYTKGKLEGSAGGGFMVVAVMRRDGELLRKLERNFTFREGDRILVMGQHDHIPELERVVGLEGDRVVSYRGATGRPPQPSRAPQLSGAPQPSRAPGTKPD